MKQKISKAFRKGETLLIYIVLDYNSFISSMDRPVHWAIVSMQIPCFLKLVAIRRCPSARPSAFPSAFPSIQPVLITLR